MAYPVENDTVVTRTSSGAFGGFRDAAGNKLPIPFALSQGSLPVGVPSSGVIGNNGILSGITAFSLVYSGGVFLYFPANAIVAGQAAGLYWTVMASATAGTIYNNQYAPGEPTAPAILIPFASAGPGAYTQTVGVDITLRAIALAAGSLGASGQLRVTANYAVPNTAGGKNPKFMLGGVTFGGGAIPLANASGVQLSRSIANRGVASQAAWGTSANVSYTTGSVQAFSVDTSVNLTVSLTASIAVATDYIMLETALMEVFPS